MVVRDQSIEGTERENMNSGESHNEFLVEMRNDIEPIAHNDDETSQAQQ